MIAAHRNFVTTKGTKKSVVPGDVKSDARPYLAYLSSAVDDAKSLVQSRAGRVTIRDAARSTHARIFIHTNKTIRVGMEQRNFTIPGVNADKSFAIPIIWNPPPGPLAGRCHAIVRSHLHESITLSVVESHVTVKGPNDSPPRTYPINRKMLPSLL